MSDEGSSDLVKAVVGGGVGGSLILWVAQRFLGKSLDREDAADAKQAAEVESLRATVHGLVGMESERKAQRDEMSALKVTMQDVSNKLSILLDRDTQQQRWRDTVDVHNRETDRQLGILSADVAGLKATLLQLREGGK